MFNDVKSGDLGGQAVGPPLPTQSPGKVSSRNVVNTRISVQSEVGLQQVPTLKCTDVHKHLFELRFRLLKT
jgi:hypothetical protein